MEVSFTEKQLKDPIVRGAVFGPEYPRLPIDNMLMISRIIKMSDTGGAYDKGEIIAELDITPDLWFFDCHFHDDPVMPGCLGLDALWQLTGLFLAWRGFKGKGRALGVGEVKFSNQIMNTTSKIVYHLDYIRVLNAGLAVGIADGQVQIDGKTIYSASKLKVGVFA